MLFTLGNVGLPGTSGFVGEFLAMLGAFQANPLVGAVAATGVILSAAYALWLYRRVVFGEIEHAHLRELSDLSRRERVMFLPLVIATLVLGVFPWIASDLWEVPVDALVEHVRAASGIQVASAE